MKSLLLSIVLASAAFAFVASEDGSPADENVIDDVAVKRAVEEDADEEAYDHHHGHGSKYCCYQVRRYLEARITGAENRAEAIIFELRKHIRANLDKLGKMEKKMDGKEEGDYEKLRAEVVALKTIVGDLEDGLKHLRGVDERRHEHLVKEIRRLENRLDEDANKLENELAKHAGDLEGLTHKADLFKDYVNGGRKMLEEAVEDRQRLRNETATLDKKLRRLSETSSAVAKDLEKKIDGATAKLESIVDEEDNDAAALESLTERANRTDGRVQSLVDRARADDERYESLSTNLHRAVRNVTDHFLEQGEKINALREERGALKKAVGAAMIDLENNYENIATNAQNITRLREAVAEQGARVAANGRVTEALGSAVKQIGDKLEALRQNLREHRVHVVERMKKLTEAIQAKR